jgi:hypothetical protein
MADRPQPHMGLDEALEYVKTLTEDQQKIFELAFVAGMSRQAQSSVDRAVNGAYDQGFKDARERFEVQIAGWTLTPGVQPGMIWIRDVGGEGGDFHVHELAEVIGKFYGERF